MSERAVLVTVRFESENRGEDWPAVIAELEALSRAAGLEVVDSVFFKQRSPSAPILVGRGQADRVADSVRTHRADTVVFERALSASQQRNLEEIIPAKTLDRTQLILDIFASRARSTEGKLQVELAQLQYLLPRLAGQGIYLSRLGGGVGTRGPGEQKLEMDRRRVRERIARRTRELDELQKKRHAGIVRKKEKDMPLAALVGYTNAGKSSLFNRLTRSSVLVKDQLFSTLDTTTRLLEMAGGQRVLLADTVGFVSRLPHHLVESFKATLEEAVNADVLIHVVDAAAMNLEASVAAVESVLSDLGAGKKKTLFVLNKIDLLNENQRLLLSGKKVSAGGIFVSAKTGEGIQAFLGALSGELGGGRFQRCFFIPAARLGLVGFLYERTEVLRRLDTRKGSYFTVRISPREEQAFRRQLSEEHQGA